MALVDFITEDAPRTLFPLDSPRIVIERGEPALRSFIEDAIFSNADVHAHFVQAPVAFALKGPMETRRVHLLDPIATLYVYDFVHRHARFFKEPLKTAAKRRYGYHLKDKAPVSATEEHQRFRTRIIELKKAYSHFARVDIANCFSSIYHHDVVSSLMTRIGDEPARRFGLFLRELNGGRSISCLPQGYFPTKAIGNLYLSFIEDNADLRSPALVRYLDDIYIFANSGQRIELDLYKLQVALSAHNLYLNSAKTDIGTTKASMRLPRINSIRKALLAKRVAAIEAAYGDDPEEVHLTDAEFKYLSELISGKDAAEGDVELALALITEDKTHAEQLAGLVFERYPHLIKTLYTYLSSAVYDGARLMDLVQANIKSKGTHEFILFWCARRPQEPHRRSRRCHPIRPEHSSRSD